MARMIGALGVADDKQVATRDELFIRGRIEIPVPALRGSHEREGKIG